MRLNEISNRFLWAAENSKGRKERQGIMDTTFEILSYKVFLAQEITNNLKILPIFAGMFKKKAFVLLIKISPSSLCFLSHPSSVE